MDEGTATARSLLEHVLDLVEYARPGDASLSQARKLIAEAGIPTKMHVGIRPEDFTEKMVYEWVLGSLADIIDKEGWLAMNSLINVGRYRLETPL